MAARSRQAIILQPEDTVATAIVALTADDVVRIGDEEVRVLDAIPFGHKFALRDMIEGEEVIKYGAPIGLVTNPIKRGEHVHLHKIKDIVQEVRAKNRV